MHTRVTYTMTRGLDWQRLVIIKNRRTRRTIRPTEARATAQVGDIKIPIPLSITNEGGVLLSLSPEETPDFTVGEHPFDVVALIRDRWVPVLKGGIVVEDLDVISPVEVSSQMQIRFRKGEDFYTTIPWLDEENEPVTATNAWMQAKHNNNNTVIDLRWYATVPSEATISGLTGNRRGYITSASGGGVTLHISDKNTVDHGTYTFDLFVEDGAGDVTCLAVGTVVVEESVSTKPA